MAKIMRKRSPITYSLFGGYEITGVDARDKRFRCIRTNNFLVACSYNIYRGTFWRVDGVTGKRTRMWEVFN